MSLLAVVEEDIKLCKAEQANINVSTQLYREILQSFTPQTKNVSKDPKDADKDTDILPEEKEEIDLLERALEKALRIRSGPSKEPHGSNDLSGPNKEACGTVVKPKGVIQTSGTSKATVKSTSKSGSLDRKETRKPTMSAVSMPGQRGTTGHHPRQYKASVGGNSIQKPPVTSTTVVPLRPAEKAQQAVSRSDFLDQGHSHPSTSRSKDVAMRSSLLSAGDLGKAVATSAPPHKEAASVSHTEETGSHSSPPQNGLPSELIAKWKSLRSKQNRLWDKAMVMQRKPVPERSHFMERMRATFPRDWPRGSPDQTRALVDRLTHQGQDLTHCCQIQQLLANQASVAGTEPGSVENKYESNLTLESLEMMAAKLRKCADRAKQEWEAWDRWRPEGGCLCPVGARGEWASAPLPPTVTYATEAEFRELEKLRMRVALLQQEMYLDQALSDTLSPQLPSMLRGPGCPNPSVLRDIYSLLAEGGEQFPALVLDTEPD
ncbi:tubulin epsilon and delta complex protein 2 [Polymixia lowei]